MKSTACVAETRIRSGAGGDGQNLLQIVLNALQELKRRFGYKVVARMLQRLESRLMIDGVCGKLVRNHPDVRFLTIHDSLLVAAESVGIVRRTIEAEFRAFGVEATVREKKAATGGTNKETIKNVENSGVAI